MVWKERRSPYVDVMIVCLSVEMRTLFLTFSLCSAERMEVKEARAVLLEQH